MLEYIKILEQLPMFEHFQQDEIEKVLECLASYTTTYLKGQSISVYNQTNTIGILLEGSIAVYKDYGQDDLVEVRKLYSPDTFGYIQVYAGTEPENQILITTKSSKVLYLDGKKLIEGNGCKYRTQMNMNMLKQIAYINFNYEVQLEIREIRSLRDKILAFLNIYSNGNNNFNISQNREEMARYLGATRPAVSKVLMELKREGIIDYYKNTFAFKNKGDRDEKI